MRALRPLAFLVLLAGCGSASPEAQVKQAFEACVKAVEASDPGGAAKVLSPRFDGPEGMGRDEARLYLVGVLRRERVGVTLLSDRVEVRGDQAFQTVEVLLTSRTPGGLLPQDGSRRTFLLRWEREDGDWHLRSLQEANPS